MSEPLTAAGAARKVVRLGKTTLLVTSADIRRGLRELGRPGTRGEADVFVAAQAVADWLDDGAPEAAARAVDEAREAIDGSSLLTPMNPRTAWSRTLLDQAKSDRQHMLHITTEGLVMALAAVENEATVMERRRAAAALVAHLRGPRDG